MKKPRISAAERELERHLAVCELMDEKRRDGERIAALEAQLAEARKDGERLNALERLAEENSIGGLLIHHQHSGSVKWTGVGLGLSHRTLRAAIDAARAAEGGKV